jgi:two-component system response regulator GlrR
VAESTWTLAVRHDGYVFRRFGLRVVEGPDEGLEARSSGEEATVGTEPGNDLLLTDRTVSRHHLLVRATARGIELRDLDSTNGTVLGGYRIRTAYAEPRSLIAVGRSVIQLDLLEEEIREELSGADHFGRVLGTSPAMRRMFALLERFAPTEGVILLEGETGTGKEVIAESVHQLSARSAGPFVVVDCGAIPPTLIESELFGHVRGAFTGAAQARRGAFEAAGGGTLFLDEIGELPLEVQPVLLRALESRTFRRVGEQQPTSADFRVIAATNRDLRAEVNRGRFRADLFYRLAVLRVKVPPLRDRSGDVPLLVHHFCQELGAGEEIRLPADLVTALAGQRWPGNVRELRAAVQRALLFGDAVRWREGAAAAPPAIDLSVTYGEAKERAVAVWEADYVRALVGAFEGNVSRSARAVGMSRSHLRALLTRYGGS